MIDKVLTLTLGGYRYVREHPQFLMTLLLVVVVPIAFLVSGQQFLSASRDNQLTLEKERIGLLHDTFGAVMRSARFDGDALSAEVRRIATENPDIVEFQVAREEQDGIRIIASLYDGNVGTWAGDPDSYGIAHTRGNETIIESAVQDGVRYWLAYRLVRDTDGTNYYIHTVTSLAKIDGVFAERIRAAYYWLFGILAIILLLIMRHVRLIDYAYLYQETKKANEMKDLFTNMIAHELRAPLTAMRGYASMIRESTNAGSIERDHATRIEEAAARLVLIINDLLDVARIQSGKLSITKERTNISSIITSVVDAMQSLAKEKNIVLSSDNKLGELFVNIDGKRLHQALTNLVSNSLKYTNAGWVAVSLDDREDRIEIRVKDTGMGIKAEDQKQLFAPFFRVESAEVGKTIGTGLGMWITKQLIELMGGSIGVESIRGVGTHIVVTMPK